MRDLDSELTTLVADLRADVAGAPWPQPDQIRVLGDRRAVRQRLTVAGVALAALALLVAVVAVPAAWRGSPPVGPAPSTSPPARAMLMSLTTVAHAGPVRAAALGATGVYVLFGGPGEVVRLDPASMAITASWPTAGDPVALAVSPSFVWVAEVLASGRSAGSDLDQVRQFDLAGHLVNTYPLISPVGLAVDGDAVWAEHQGPTGTAVVSRLHDAVLDPTVYLASQLPGPDAGTPVRACPEAVYAVSQNPPARSVSVQRVQDAGTTGLNAVDSDGAATLVCQDPGVALVLSGSRSALFRMDLDRGRGSAAGSLPATAHPIAIAGTRIWLAAVAPETGATLVWPVDTRDGRGAQSVSLHGEFSVAVADGTHTYVFGTDPAQPAQVIVATLAST